MLSIDTLAWWPHRFQSSQLKFSFRVCLSLLSERINGFGIGAGVSYPSSHRSFSCLVSSTGVFHCPPPEESLTAALRLGHFLSFLVSQSFHVRFASLSKDVGVLYSTREFCFAPFDNCFWLLIGLLLVTCSIVKIAALNLFERVVKHMPLPSCWTRSLWGEFSLPMRAVIFHPLQF